MSEKKPKLAIVIVSYNTKDVLLRCLTSLEKQKKPKDNLEIIVVDNNSQDQTIESIKKERFKVTLIANQENLGFCQGNNKGIKYALSRGADYVMLLNSDAYTQNCFWQPLVAFLKENKEAGVVTPKIYFAPGHEYHKKRYQKADQGKVIWAVGGVMDWNNVAGANRGVDEIDKGQFEKAKKVDFASGCCLLARAEVWQKVNYLDERYFMYYEDADFCQKAKSLGWEVFYVPQSKVWHLNAKSSKVGGFLQDYFISRNRLLFGLRWAPFRAKLALARESGRLLLKGRKWQRAGVRDYYLGKFGKGSWK
ncbi:MAG: glycosyltransferase family 2 protein [Candidatus Shapirobacteria bacterium]